MGKIEQILGKRFRDLRESANISQVKIAKMAKTSALTVNRFEGGKQLPRGDTLEDLLKALDADIDTFLFGEITNSEKAERADLLLSLISRLSTLNKRQLSALTDFIDGDAFAELASTETKGKAL